MTKLLLPIALLGACAANTGALEHRVTALEQRPAPTDHAHELALAQERTTELMAKVDAQQQRIADLEAVVHELGSEVADALARAPMKPQPPTDPVVPPMHAGLDPAKVYAVDFAGAPVYGKPDAAVTLVAGVQFPEPYTHKAWATLAQLRTQYGGDLRIAIETFVVHPQATDSTTAACAVALQGEAKLARFEGELYDKVMANGPRTWLDAAGARALAKAEGIDMGRFDRDLPKCKIVQDRSQRLLKQLGQGATPTWWINGRPVSGAVPIAQFQAVIDEELKKAAADRASGGRPATYYQRAVLNQGAKTGP